MKKIIKPGLFRLPAILAAGGCLVLVSLLTGCTWTAESDSVRIRSGGGEREQEFPSVP